MVFLQVMIVAAYADGGRESIACFQLLSLAFITDLVLQKTLPRDRFRAVSTACIKGGRTLTRTREAPALKNPRQMMA